MCGQEPRPEGCARHSGRWEERTRVGTLALRILHDGGLCIPDLVSCGRFFITGPRVGRVDDQGPRERHADARVVRDPSGM